MPRIKLTKKQKEFLSEDRFEFDTFLEIYTSKKGNFSFPAKSIQKHNWEDFKKAVEIIESLHEDVREIWKLV